jgi:hypothetical protein
MMELIQIQTNRTHFFLGRIGTKPKARKEKIRNSKKVYRSLTTVSPCTCV